MRIRPDHADFIDEEKSALACVPGPIHRDISLRHQIDGATAALKSWLSSTAGASYLTQDRQQWTARYSRDLGTQNGFKNADELTLRYLVFF